jgi:DNA polymerase III subunit epsilon
MTPCFVAIDFETADAGPDSACAVGLVRVEGWEVVTREARLIRPPRRYIRFSYLHGITWTMLKDAPPFAEVWPPLAPLLDGAEYLVAHNAPFDRGVLRACCAGAGLGVPPLPFVCSMWEARRAWGVRPTRLPDVCRFLGLPLTHHDALSDAEAAARIVMAARSGRTPAAAPGQISRSISSWLPAPGR